MDTPLMTNLINLLIGLATLGAVIVALFAIRENRKQSREDWLHSQQLAIEERQHQSRPIVVPLGEISHHTQDGNVDWEQTHQISPPPQPGPPGTTDAGTRTVTQEIMLLNMGDGVAFNVHSILYGPMPAPGFQYISWNNGPIQGK